MRETKEHQCVSLDEQTDVASNGVKCGPQTENNGEAQVSEISSNNSQKYPDERVISSEECEAAGNRKTLEKDYGSPVLRNLIEQHAEQVLQGGDVLTVTKCDELESAKLEVDVENHVSTCEQASNDTKSTRVANSRDKVELKKNDPNSEDSLPFSGCSVETEVSDDDSVMDSTVISSNLSFATSYISSVIRASDKNNGVDDANDVSTQVEPVTSTNEKRVTQQSTNLRDHRPRKAKEGLIFVEHVLAQAVHHFPTRRNTRPVFPKTLKRRGASTNSCNRSQVKRSRTFETDSATDNIETRIPVLIAESGPAISSQEGEVLVEKVDSTLCDDVEVKASYKPEEQAIPNRSAKKFVRFQGKVWRVRSLNRTSNKTSKVAGAADIPNGNSQDDDEIQVVSDEALPNKKVLCNPYEQSSLRRVGHKKSSVADNSCTSSNGRRWWYSNDDMSYLLKDGKFVVHRKDLQNIYDRLIIWRIVTSISCLRKYVPMKIDGRICHVAVDSFTPVDLNSETFIYNYQPVLFDLIVDSSECSLGMYHPMPYRSHTHLGAFSSTADLFEPYQMYLKQMIIHAMSDNKKFQAEVMTTGFSRVEEELNNLINRLLSTSCWPKDTQVCINYYPHLVLSRSAIIKNLPCVSCITMNRNSKPYYKMAFNGMTYDPESLQFIHEVDPPQPDHQFCAGCAQWIKTFHRLVHYKYWTHIAIREILARLYQLLQNSQQFEIDAVYKFMVADFKWMKAMFFEFQTLLAEANKYLGQMEKRITKATAASNESTSGMDLSDTSVAASPPRKLPQKKLKRANGEKRAVKSFPPKKNAVKRGQAKPNEEKKARKNCNQKKKSTASSEVASLEVESCKPLNLKTYSKRMIKVSENQLPLSSTDLYSKAETIGPMYEQHCTTEFDRVAQQVRDKSLNTDFEEGFHSTSPSQTSTSSS